MLVIFLTLLVGTGMAQTAQRMSLEYWIGGATEEICRKTRGGCYCKEQWPHKGSLLRGCQRPDDDPHGPWCIIDQNDPLCTFDPQDDTHKVITEHGNLTGDYWHYCNSYYCPHGSGVQIKERCYKTQAGCDCMQRWSYSGGDGFLYVDYSGCANPDNDKLGEWCIVDPVTCVDTSLAQNEPDVQPKNLGSDSWDRCQCKGPVPGKVSKSSNDAKFSTFLNITINDNCDPGVVPSCMRR
eukprot:TRINITY_DN2837_c0_g1_i14.p2 TRINITY_DN2837_c0_g1~~TRINITY_DN2837_c0_g1_i14.p2  ORF type:complete len:238 (-),score=32.32 TRINITY_DN2837_c0_g1_i14:893-1606(-)